MQRHLSLALELAWASDRAMSFASVMTRFADDGSSAAVHFERAAASLGHVNLCLAEIIPACDQQNLETWPRIATTRSQEACSLAAPRGAGMTQEHSLGAQCDAPMKEHCETQYS